MAKFPSVTIFLGVALILPGCGSDQVSGVSDDFSSSVTVSGAPFTGTGNTTTATSDATDPVPSCGAGSTSNSVWFSYTASNNDTIIAETVESDYDTVLSVWTGSPGSFVDVTCNDDDFVSLTLQSRVVFAGTSATTYHFMVSAFEGDGGNLVFNLDLRTPPANDDFANIAIISSAPFSDSKNTEGATSEVSDPISLCDNDQLARLDILPQTVWYQYTPAADETVTASTLGSSYDTVLSVWTGTPGDFVDVACNDDIDFPTTVQSEVTFTATGGVAYHFMVTSFFGNGGDLSFNMTVP